MRSLRTLTILLTLSLLWTPLFAQDASDKKDDKKWDVNAAHGPTKDVNFTTNEGTWITVDVHPGGQKLVFDLLETCRVSCGGFLGLV